MRGTLDLPRQALAVIGSRSIGDHSHTRYAMDSVLNGHAEIVSGGARGVDRDAEDYGAFLGLHVVSYRPKRAYAAVSGYEVHKFLNGENTGPVLDANGKPLWYPDFRSAALSRNWWIVGDARTVLALWDGNSTGTAHGIAAATRLGRDLRIWMDGDS